ncbi:MAG: hypothetical protein K0S41_2052 [Anaerocolumna sp.]|jgi:hypothetical protein|nr:hypothetical protein [Anaerocolumna sp.]
MKIVKMYLTQEDLQKMILDKIDERYKNSEILLKSVNSDNIDGSIEFTCYVAPKWDDICYLESEFNKDGFNAKRYNLLNKN